MEGKGVRVPTLVRPPVQDEADARAREVCQRAHCDMWQARAALDIAHWDVERAVENLKVVSALAPRPFTWEDAREIAVVFRDGFLMIVKGLERKFGIGKK